MWVASYRHGRDTHPRLIEFSSADAFLTSYASDLWPVVEHKMLPDHAPCALCAPSWAPVRASYRSNAATEEVWALVLDWDDVKDPALLVQAALPFQGLIHTTLNHWRKPTRLRGIFPYSKPIPPNRHPKVFQAYQDYFGTRADHVSKSASAQYYFGRYQDEHTAFLRLPGIPLDPWQLPGSETFTREDLHDLAKRYRRTDAVLGGRLRALYDGLPFAQPVELGDGRDDAAFRLCTVIAKHYPAANPERVALLFAPSLQVMALEHPEGALTHERILEKLYRLFSAQTLQEEREIILQRQFWRAHGHPDREGTYLPSELEAMGSPQKNDWILQHEHGLYIRTCNGFDGPVQYATLRTQQALSVVPSVQLFRADGTGYPGPALASNYGRTVIQVMQSLRAQRASFDPATRILTFAPTPLRQLTPLHSTFVEAWFSAAFTPEDRANVEAWLSLLPYVSRPLSCLMLVGDPDTGKNLFAASANRFWLASKPASARRVLGRFNAEVLSCPLIWADEELPKGPDGYFPLEDFKHLIGADVFSVEQKGIEACSVEGYTRWLATSNNDLFLSAYSHTNEGNAALAQRILRANILPESQPFLADNRKYLREFVQSSELARHVLTLPIYQSNERFGIVSPVAFERTLAVGSTWGGRICQIVVTWLLKPTTTQALVIDRGRLWVNGGRLFESWRALTGSFVECPRDARQLLECLGPLCLPVRHGSKGERKQVNGLKYREMDLAKIRHWAETNDWATTEQIDAALTPHALN